MKTLAVFGFFIGAIALFSWFTAWGVQGASQANAIALNYGVYRSHALRNIIGTNATGDIADASLSLPTAWKPLRQWKTRVDGGVCYVYGPAATDEVLRIRELFTGSYAVGQKVSGLLSPRLAGSAPFSLPGFIPESAVVTAVRMQ